MEGALLLMEFVLEHGKGPSSEKGGLGSTMLQSRGRFNSGSRGSI